MKLDKEEQEILDAYEKGRIKARSPSKKELHMVKSIAESTFRKNRRITIRLYDHDYKGIQKKARRMGIPYQTLISGMIHQYVEGDLVEKMANKSLHLTKTASGFGR
jgi:predicted DNA binding CopG/RHH family protein